MSKFLNEFSLSEISEILAPVFKKIDVDRENSLIYKKKFDIGKNLQLITSKLRLIFGSIRSLKEEEMQQYYFNEETGLTNITMQYQFILKLQDLIVSETGLPFIYDRFTVLKILRISMNKYNEIIEQCYDRSYIYSEDIANIFMDIETMLLSDRNNSAENGTKNFKAIDSVNKYKRSSGGFGVLVEKDDTNKNNEKVYIITPEETQKKLHNFGFSNMLESQETSNDNANNDNSKATKKKAKK